MSIKSESAVDEEENEPQQPTRETYHPNAPSDELFDISTTVDPSYIISLIRKLLPPNNGGDNAVDKVTSFDASSQGFKNGGNEGSAALLSHSRVSNGQSIDSDAMDFVGGSDSGCEVVDNDLEGSGSRLVGEELWEADGCILWDLVASKTHAEFMVTLTSP